MNRKLLSALKVISEVDYIVLGYHIQTANMCRRIMDRYKIDDATMANELGLTKKMFSYYKKGAYEYSIKDWAIMQRIEYTYGSEELQREIKNQIKFPPYKDSETRLMERGEKN